MTRQGPRWRRAAAAMARPLPEPKRRAQRRRTPAGSVRGARSGAPRRSVRRLCFPGRASEGGLPESVIGMDYARRGGAGAHKRAAGPVRGVSGGRRPRHSPGLRHMGVNGRFRIRMYVVVCRKIIPILLSLPVSCRLSSIHLHCLVLDVGLPTPTGGPGTGTLPAGRPNHGRRCRYERGIPKTPPLPAGTGKCTLDLR